MGPRARQHQQRLVHPRPSDRPDPSRQVRHDKDAQRESDNKGILDKEHAAHKRAHAALEKSIVASIGTDLCSAISASHGTGFLRNCSALFMI
jgi:hypothetical protein